MRSTKEVKVGEPRLVFHKARVREACAQRRAVGIISDLPGEDRAKSCGIDDTLVEANRERQEILMLTRKDLPSTDADCDFVPSGSLDFPPWEGPRNNSSWSR